MAIPDSSYFSTWDVTSRTEKQVLDAKLWGIMQPKTPALDLITKGPELDTTYYEWEYRQPDVKIVTSTDESGKFLNNTTETDLRVKTAAEYALLTPGTVLFDRTQGLGLGSLKKVELVRVTAQADDTNFEVTVVRDYGLATNGSTVGTGAAHSALASWEILYHPRQEGSSPEIDRHKPFLIASNRTVTEDFYLTISGSQKKRAMNNIAAGQQMAIQWEDRMAGAFRRIESTLFYGTLEKTTPGGESGYIRQMKGAYDFIVASGGNVTVGDGSALVPGDLDDAFAQIYADSGDPEDPYVIFCGPTKAQRVSHWGEDRIRMTQGDRQYGRIITSFMSDLGFTAQVVPTMQVHPDDIFIINTRKWLYLPYRPWFKKAPEQLADAEVQRAITEFTCQMVDPLTAHAALTNVGG
jgi:hypothetical protein